MKRILKVSAICIVTLVLAGCFPSQRLYVIENCDDNTCGKFMVESELAFVQEPNGDSWRLWQKKPAGYFDEVCIGTIDGDKFSCDVCGSGGYFWIAKVSSSECEDYSHCIEFDHAGPQCPNPGSGSGGHNDH